MAFYRLAGQDFHFPYFIPELDPFESPCIEPTDTGAQSLPASYNLSNNTFGWVGNAQRLVELWSAPPGSLLKVAGGSDFYIAPGGQSIVRVQASHRRAESWEEPPLACLTGLDRDILLGPSLVLALAQREVWCLHASAAAWQGRTFAFLGESGAGKSTLAASLSHTGTLDWRLVADDILPVTLETAGVTAWPRFPQLKLPVEAQPGPALPEHIPLDRLVLLMVASEAQQPELIPLSCSQAAQALLGQTAGVRLFDLDLLSVHMAFCARAGEALSTYQLTYPHRPEALPIVKELLETIC